MSKSKPILFPLNVENQASHIVFLPADEACQICGNKVSNQWFTTSEKMFGLGHHFDYFVCEDCGVLYRKQPLEDAGAYYPQDYYSFRLNQQRGLKARLERNIKILRAGLLAGKNEYWRKALLSRFPNPGIDALLHLKPELNTHILDYGCGSGSLLFDMKEQGFRHLLGADPFIKDDIAYPNGLIIKKINLTMLKGQFDLIMMHHVFEHEDSPLELLRNAADHLTNKGRLLLRIPLAGSWAWEQYNENWVQLDAPRHSFLHTPKSMTLLAQQAGLQLEETIYDGNSFQFWGSEQYRLKYTLAEHHDTPLMPRKGLFSKKVLKAMQAFAIELNKTGKADQAAFILRKEQS